MRFQSFQEKKGLFFSLGVALVVVISIVAVICIPWKNWTPANPLESNSESTDSVPIENLSRRELFIEVANGEVDTIGGSKYIEWYGGFDENAYWCAIFTAWCAGQADLIEDGTVPKYSLVTDYYNYYSQFGRLHLNEKDSPYVPEAGDLAFFDWEGDGQPDHIGIVSRVTETTVYVVNGNNGYDIPSKNVVKLNEYAFDYPYLVAYATPDWD